VIIAPHIRDFEHEVARTKWFGVATLDVGGPCHLDGVATAYQSFKE
jgi:hypothetical protein